MVAFTDDLNLLKKANDPNYMGASREWRPSDVHTNTSMGKLFEGLGNTIGEAAGAFDRSIQENLRNQVRDTVEPIRQEFTPTEADVYGVASGQLGVNKATKGLVLPTGEGPTQGDGTQLPSYAQSRIASLRGPAAAVEAGEMSQSAYYARLDAAAAELRNRYPSYQDQIDHEFRKLTGVDPANALRNARLAEMQRLQSANDAAENKLDTRYHRDAEWMGAIGFPQGMTKEYYAQHYDEIQIKIAAAKSDKNHDEYLLRQANMEKVGSENWHMRVEKAATSQAATMMREKFQTVLNALDEQATALQKQGATADPKAITELGAKIETNKRKALSDFDQWINLTFPGMKPEVRDKIRNEVIIKPMDTVTAALNGGDFSAAKAAATTIATRGSQVVNNIVQKYPEMQVLAGVRTLLGEQSMQTIVQGNSADILPKTLQIFKDRSLYTIAGDGADPATSPPPKASEVIKDQKEYGGSAGQHIVRTLRDVQTLATSDNPRTAYRAVSSLYDDPKLWTSLNPGESKQLYALLGGQDFTDKMVKLSKQGEDGAKAFGIYAKWMEDNAPTVIREAVSNVKEYQQETGTKAPFDPKTFQFMVPQVPPSALYQGATTEFGAPLTINPESAAYNQVNQILRQLQPVLEAKYGAAAPQKAAEIIAQTAATITPAGGGFIKALTAGMGALLTPENLNAAVNPMGTLGNKIVDGIANSELGQRAGAALGINEGNTPAPKEKAPGKRSEGVLDTAAKVASAVGNFVFPEASAAEIIGSANNARSNRIWGNPHDPDFKEKHTTVITTSTGADVRVNNAAAEAFKGFLDELEATGYKINSISGYSMRNKKGGGGISQHAYGNAIDINPDQNPFMKRLKTDMPANISEIAARHGISWGGDWKSVKDSMHFEFTGKTLMAQQPVDDNGNPINPAPENP